MIRSVVKQRRENIGVQPIHHLTSLPIRRNSTTVNWHAIDPNSRLMYAASNVCFRSAIGWEANDISLLGIDTDFAPKRVVSPVYF